MPTEIRRDWADSVVLISSVDKQNPAFGSGFVVYRNQETAWVVTCAHVINDVGGQKEARVNGKLATTVACGSDSLDLAVLRVPRLKSSKPFQLSVFTKVINDVVAMGYETLVSGVVEVKRLNGKFVGSVRFTSSSDEDQVRAWKIQIQDDDPLQRGYSGGPVIDRLSEKVVGVLSHARGEGKEGRAISIEELPRLWKDMPQGLLGNETTLPNSGLPKIASIGFLLLLLALGLGGLFYLWGGNSGTPTSTQVASNTVPTSVITLSTAPATKPLPTEKPTLTPTSTASSSPSHTSPPTPTQAATSTYTPSLTPTNTASPIPTHTVTPGTPGPIGTPSRMNVSVESVAISSLNNTAIGLANGLVQIWASPTNDQPRLSLNKHFAPVRALEFSPDGKWLVSTADDQMLIIWNTETSQIATQTHFASRLLDIDFSPDGSSLAIALTDGTAQVFAFSEGQLSAAQTLPHLQQVWSVAFSSKDNLLATGSKDTNVWLWQNQGGQWVNLAKLREPEGSITSLAFSPDGSVLAAGAEDKTINLWQMENGKARHIRTLFGHTDVVRDLAFSPDGTLLVSASEDSIVRLWRVGDGRLLARLQGHRAPVNSVAFSPDGTIVVSGADDFTFRYWQVK